MDLLSTQKTILVTGAAGFIGSAVSTQLLKSEHNVIGVDNFNDYYDTSLKKARIEHLKTFDDFRLVSCNIKEKEKINEIFDEYKPQIVVNLAAQAGVRYSIEHPDVYMESNVIGFFNILEACRQNKIEHLVYASSSSVYGMNKKVPFSTTDMVDHPVSFYAATKKSNELMAYCYSHLYNIPTTGLRFFTVYGPWGRPDMAYFLFTDKMLKGEPIKVFNNGNMYRDFTYIDDIVNGVEMVINKAPSLNADNVPYKIYNIGNNNPEKLMDYIACLEKALSDAYGREIIANKVFYPMQPGDVKTTYADIDDLVADFGFKPSTSIQEGLKKFAEWHHDFYGK